MKRFQFLQGTCSPQAQYPASGLQYYNKRTGYVYPCSVAKRRKFRRALTFK